MPVSNREQQEYDDDDDNSRGNSARCLTQLVISSVPSSRF
jgi:hypothetical protein